VFPSDSSLRISNFINIPFFNSILTSLTQIESKLERILKSLPGLQVTGSFDPVTGLPTLSASIQSRKTPQLTKKEILSKNGTYQFQDAMLKK
jgi:hypothetical protein